MIYVMGAGRSGSTILGVTLGNCEGVFFAGELDKWLARSGIPQLEDDERARLWEQVRENTDDEGLFGYAAQRCLERSSALFRLRDWPMRRRIRGRYRHVYEGLYRAIAEATGTGCIVDTSHYPLRAKELQAVRGIELFLVFLVRDPRSVIASLDRRDVTERRFSEPVANAYLWLTYTISLFVFLRHRSDRRMFVRHEDFLADPETVLGQVLTLTGSPTTLPDLEERLETGLGFQGNRLLRSDGLLLEGPSDRRVRASWASQLIQLPWRLVFSWLNHTQAYHRSAGVPQTP